MRTEQDREMTVVEPLAMERAFQDSFIAKRLPAWLRSANPDQLTALGTALRQSLITRHHLSERLARIQSIDSFAITTLEAALKERFGDEYDVRRWTLIVGEREPIINQLPVGSHLTEAIYKDVPLIEAVLRNFTLAETEANGQPRGNRLTSARQGTIRPPTAIEFARFCREIDVGGQYQRHLDEVLQSHTTPDHSETMPELLASSHRYAMLVDAYEARLKGSLSEREFQLISGMCNEDTLGRLDGHPVVAKQLTLLGCRLEQIVVLDVIDEGLIRNVTRRVLVHIPGDSHGAWCVFDSLRAFANALGRRLRSGDYQKFFSQFVRRRDSQLFFSVVIAAYADLVTTANFDLEEHMYAYPMPLFESLATARIRQIKDDAAMIAVPTSDVDRRVQQEHDQRLAAEGWTLLNVAGFFIPIIGVGLLTITAWKLLGETFHGIAAWRHGDTSQALDHLINVGTDLAVIGALATGVTVASRVWNRSSVVDSLVPAQLEDGTVKLWNQDLVPLRSDSVLNGAERDAQGIYRLGGQCWVEMDGHYYPVVQHITDGEWRIQPKEGHGPMLSHNGAGAWRLWCEQPDEWDNVHGMFRRFGGECRALDDEQIDHVLNAHTLNADNLRAMHMHGLAPDAALLDSVMRLRLDQRIRDVVRCLRSGEDVIDLPLLKFAQRLPGTGGLNGSALADAAWTQRRQWFQAAYTSFQDTAQSGAEALRRLFTSLHGPAANELIRAATIADRQQLQSTGKASLSLAEAARASVVRIRTARAYEALVADTPQNADVARVVLSMLKHLPGAATGVRWRLIEGAVDGPELLQTEVGMQAFGLIHQQGMFQLVDTHGTLLGEPGELFDVMTAAYSERQRAAMGLSDPITQNLRVSVGRQMIRRRQEVEVLFGKQQRIGWFKLPQRLTDGRMGYLLSGRGLAGRARGRRPRSLFVMVRDLYPTFSDEQVNTWINNTRGAGLQVEAELARLRHELGTLNSHLHHWQNRASTTTSQTSRRYIRESLLNCWRRRVNTGVNISEQAVNYRYGLHGLGLEALPDLPAGVSFAHVSELALLGMALTSLPDSFLSAFRNLRTLELSGNRLTRLPQALIQMTHLRELELVNNQIVLDPGQSTILASCESLEYLNLSYNPLGRSFSVSGMRRLRILYLTHTGITDIPNALVTRPDLTLADLRGNQITQLPAPFYAAPGWVRRVILLANNPLSASEAVRLRASQIGLRAVSEEEAVIQTPRSVRQSWLDVAQSPMRGDMSVYWEYLQMEPGSGDFFGLLERLRETADFRQNGHALANRVFTMIRLMYGYTSLREDLLTHATETLTCQDSVALCFSNLELRMLVWQAQYAVEGQQRALLSLGRQLWRLDEVDRIALEDIRARKAAGGEPDEIEVALAYRVALRDELDLPAQPNDMLFGLDAELEMDRIFEVRNQVMERETDSAVASSMVARDFWQEYLLRTQSARFDAVDAPFHARLAAVMDDTAIQDGGRVMQMNNIRDERLAAQRTLMHEITLAALQENRRSTSVDT